MSKRTIASLVAELGYEIKDGKLRKFRKELTVTQRVMRDAKRHTRRSAHHFKQFGRNLAVIGIQVYAVQRALRALIGGLARSGDEARTQGRIIGLSAEEYQRLSYAADVSKTNIQEVSQAMTRSVQAIDQAAQGSGRGADAFRRLGIEATKADGSLKSQQEILFEVADNLRGLNTETEQMTVLQSIYGRTAGPKMFHLLQRGSHDIRALMSEAEDFNALIGDDLVKTSEDYNDNLARMRWIFRGLRNQIAADILPVFNDLLERFIAWYKEGENAEKVLRAVKAVLRGLSSAMATMMAIKIVGMFVSLYKAAKAAALAVKSFVIALKIAKAAGAAAMLPFIKIVAIVGAVAAALYGVYRLVREMIKLVRGEKSWFDEIMPADEAAGLKNALLGIWDTLKQLWETVKGVAQTLWQAIAPIIPVLTRLFGAILQIAVRIWAIWLRIYSTIFIFVVKAVKEVLSWVEPIVQMLMAAFDAVERHLVPALKKLEPIFRAVGAIIETVIIGPLRWVGKQVDRLMRFMGVDTQAEERERQRQERVGRLFEGATGRIRERLAEIRQDTRVGAVTVNVQGTTDMRADDLARAVKKGTEQGLGKVHDDIAIPVGA